MLVKHSGSRAKGGMRGLSALAAAVKVLYDRGDKDRAEPQLKALSSQIDLQADAYILTRPRLHWQSQTLGSHWRKETVDTSKQRESDIIVYMENSEVV